MSCRRHPSPGVPKSYSIPKNLSKVKLLTSNESESPTPIWDVSHDPFTQACVNYAHFSETLTQNKLLLLVLSKCYHDTDKRCTDFQDSHIFLIAKTKSSTYLSSHIYVYTNCANTCCAAREDHSISIHEKSGLTFCSQPNLATLSPSALPSAGLSAACLEVNSFMIPLSVLPIFKWLILPLWQLLAQAVAYPPPSCFSASSEQQYPVVTGHAISDQNRFYKACSPNKMTHLEPLEIDRYPIPRGTGVCNKPILFNSQQITLGRLLNKDISFNWQLRSEMRSHATSINACMRISFSCTDLCWYRSIWCEWWFLQWPV